MPHRCIYTCVRKGWHTIIYFTLQTCRASTQKILLKSLDVSRDKKWFPCSVSICAAQKMFCTLRGEENHLVNWAFIHSPIGVRGLRFLIRPNLVLKDTLKDLDPSCSKAVPSTDLFTYKGVVLFGKLGCSEAARGGPKGRAAGRAGPRPGGHSCRAHRPPATA